MAPPIVAPPCDCLVWQQAGKCPISPHFSRVVFRFSTISGCVTNAIASPTFSFKCSVWRVEITRVLGVDSVGFFLCTRRCQQQSVWLVEDVYNFLQFSYSQIFLSVQFSLQHFVSNEIENSVFYLGISLCSILTVFNRLLYFSRTMKLLIVSPLPVT